MASFRFTQDFEGDLLLPTPAGGRRRRYRIPEGVVVDLPEEVALWVNRDRARTVVEATEDAPTRDLDNLVVQVDDLLFPGPI